jgi:3'(2'), 5'-bisphosphate nucleotidase
MSNAPEDRCAQLEQVVFLSAEAGRRILRIYETKFSVASKEDRSPLTEADLASHRIIVHTLASLSPGVPVLSEESAAIGFAERRRWSRFWLIDPLDGTREFVNRNGEFTVNIALIEDHQPVLGVVHVPVTDVSYFACRGLGAFKRTAEDGDIRLRVCTHAEDPLRVVGSRSHRGTSLGDFLSRVGLHEIVSMGSSLKFCIVAEGAADIYPRLGPTSEWDTAAAQCIVEEAGGKVVDLDLRPLRYNTKESLLNPHFLVFGDSSYDWRAVVHPSGT